MALDIRPASPSDLSAICILAEEIAAQHAHSEPGTFAAPPGLERDREYWKSGIAPQDGITFIAHLQGVPAGFVSAVLSSTHALTFLVPKRVCRVGTIVVATAFQKMGVGVALLDAVKEWAQNEGASAVRLEVFAFNENAIRFYEHVGYQVQSLNYVLPLD